MYRTCCSSVHQKSSVYKPLVWVVGDSVVQWTCRVAASSAGEMLYDVVNIRWLGKRGLHLTKLNDCLHHCWESEQSNQDYIIINVGTNYLGIPPKKAILEAIKCVLTVTRSSFPKTITFWSVILPRHIPRRTPSKQGRACPTGHQSLGR